MASEGSDLPALRAARESMDDIFAIVQPDSVYERPIPLRHRIVFYIGHVEAFDWNLMSTHLSAPASPDAELDRLFAFGIDPDSEVAPADQPADWPAMERIHQYCRETRERVDSRWHELPELLRHVAIEHRLMHAETVAYMLHAMPSDRLVGSSSPESVVPASTASNFPLSVPVGRATLGKPRENGFGWDNEFEQTTVAVESFDIDRYKVTNGDYLAFVHATGARPPHFWRQRKGEWWLRRMFDEVPLPLDWPVYVTLLEAMDYAEWRGAALPTEAQWHRAAFGTPDETERAYPWGDDPPSARFGNFDGHRWDPVPVAASPPSASAFGVEGMAGNGWEWTSSLFRPFPGFRPFPFYAGYSSNFFDDEHYVLKGGSPRTDRVFLRRSFRNWFRRDYPWVFATFRCVHNNR